MQRIVLAYSGGLDTSVAVKWLADEYDAEIIAVTMELGLGAELDHVRERAPVEPEKLPAVEGLAEGADASEHAAHSGHDVPVLVRIGTLAAEPQCRVQGGALLGRIDLLSAE